MIERRWPDIVNELLLAALFIFEAGLILAGLHPFGLICGLLLCALCIGVAIHLAHVHCHCPHCGETSLIWPLLIKGTQEKLYCPGCGKRVVCVEKLARPRTQRIQSECAQLRRKSHVDG